MEQKIVKHTPTPYKSMKDPHGDWYVATEANEALTGWSCVVQTKDDAEFIVLACNSHDEANAILMALLLTFFKPAT